MVSMFRVVARRSLTAASTVPSGPPGLVRSSPCRKQHHPQQLHHPSSSLLQQQHRAGHTVRVVLIQDLPEMEKKRGQVMEVKAGYNRNYLIPQKLALYATPENFARLGIKDPDEETPEEKRLRLEREAAEEVDEDLQAAKLLRKYLSNKVLKIWRNFDRNTNTMHPGMVDAKAVRQKLSKQLNIDLEEESEDSQEKVHLQATPLDEFEDWTEQELEKALDAIPTDKPCQTQVREMGLFLAKISLAGGYSVPLKVRVLRR